MLETLVLAVALSMDAFAAALGQGAGARGQASVWPALRTGLAFGLAQGLMPLLGWALGVAFAAPFRAIDHWIAFGLLAGIGLHMLKEALWSADRPEEAPAGREVRGWLLLGAALATSIDAAVAGITLPLLGPPVGVACLTIGTVTLLTSTLGVRLGAALGAAAGHRAEAAGGVILIGLGIKILATHLAGLA